MTRANAKLDYDNLDEAELCRLLAERDAEAVRVVTTRNNQGLYRAAWSILKNRADAEDAVQAGYLKAFANIGAFEGRSALSTWLTRIVINEALARKAAADRRRARLETADVPNLNDYREKLMRGSQNAAPDTELMRGQVRELLEQAIAQLPEEFRPVFVLREIEGLSVQETAEALDLIPATVKTRHLRARRRLQKALAPELKAALSGSFPFAGASCAAMTERVIEAFCRQA